MLVARFTSYCRPVACSGSYIFRTPRLSPAWFWSLDLHGFKTESRKYPIEIKLLLSVKMSPAEISNQIIISGPLQEIVPPLTWQLWRLMQRKEQMGSREDKKKLRGWIFKEKGRESNEVIPLLDHPIPNSVQLPKVVLLVYRWNSDYVCGFRFVWWHNARFQTIMQFFTGVGQFY